MCLPNANRISLIGLLVFMCVVDFGHIYFVAMSAFTAFLDQVYPALDDGKLFGREIYLQDILISSLYCTLITNREVRSRAAIVLEARSFQVHTCQGTFVVYLQLYEKLW